MVLQVLRQAGPAVDVVLELFPQPGSRPPARALRGHLELVAPVRRLVPVGAERALGQSAGPFAPPEVEAWSGIAERPALAVPSRAASWASAPEQTPDSSVDTAEIRLDTLALEPASASERASSSVAARALEPEPQSLLCRVYSPSLLELLPRPLPP